MTHTDFELEWLYTNRVKLNEIIEQQPTEKLLRIPAGFSNNVLWHIGHCVVSQQRLVYWRSGLPMHISDEYMNNFKIGTSPQNWTSAPDIAEVKNSLLTTFEKLKQDISNGIFKTYQPHKTSLGFTLNSYTEPLPMPTCTRQSTQAI